MSMQEQGFYDIYGVWYVPFWQRPLFFWISVGLIVLLLGLVVWYLITKYRAQKKENIPYWQQSLNQLASLKQGNVATVTQGSLFYAQLTAILKQYMQVRYGFDARGKTDDEVIAMLEHKQFNPQYLNQLKTMFQGSLYIKFANVQAAQQQIEKDLDDAVNFIKNNMPS